MGLPVINHSNILIVNLKEFELTAILISILFEDGFYVPIFSFPEARVAKNGDVDETNSISRSHCAQSKVFINNAIARLGDFKRLIFVGLSEYQKSYLTFKNDQEVIDIGTFEDIYHKLSNLIPSYKTPLRCKSKDIFNGLLSSKVNNSYLIIDESAEDIIERKQNHNGLIVIENQFDSSTIIGINYGLSIDANIVLVEEVSEDLISEMHQNISYWKNDKDLGAYDQVREEIEKLTFAINFTNFQFCTFFTSGVPYSLILKNIIPMTYVHLEMRPDHFIMNNLLYEKIKGICSGVIFSPGFFLDEETANVMTIFEKNNYHQRAILNEHATVSNLDYHLQYFPYTIFHICSHGGEVGGYEVRQEFVDSAGDNHIMEYDEVIGFDKRHSDNDMHVQSKSIFRKLDGMKWRSRELKEKYADYIFHDMHKAWKSHDEANVVRKPKNIIPGSCAIACTYSLHQGMVRTLAGQQSPFIFNNTCWSAIEIAKSFLSQGCRGYIGTLWAIDNGIAEESASVFYQNVFGNTLLNSIQEGLKVTKESDSEDIYLYWGLHFSTLPFNIESIDLVGRQIFDELMMEYIAYKKMEQNSNEEIAENAREILSQIKEDLHSFPTDYFEKFQQVVKSRFKEKL